MRQFQILINGEWVNAQPANGDHFRELINGKVVRQSYWFEPEIDNRTIYQITNELVTSNGQPVSKFAGNYYVNSGDAIQLQGTLTDGESTPDITVPITLKMPIVRHANGQPTQDEIYLNVTLSAGVITATGVLPWSGDWKILTERVNEALQRIGADWKLQHPDVTFLA